MDYSYSGMVSCNCIQTIENEWIIDSGATHHITNEREDMRNISVVEKNTSINLPTGESATVVGKGEVSLCKNLNLKNVMLVPSFKHRRISVQKLNKDNNCKVMFLPHCCIVPDAQTSQIKGVGKERNGLYYMVNEAVEDMVKKLREEVKNREKTNNQRNNSAFTVEGTQCAKWSDRC
ncbi:Retrovirus-related Pol polyprotein from transposon RE1 [Bienertia sinuspersici]